MFERNILSDLLKWKGKAGRKPLVLRGARQVGKTSVVLEFGRRAFKNTIHLNLEKAEHRAAFSQTLSTAQTLHYIEVLFNTQIVAGETLLFIDEIQISGLAMAQLRYFYEDSPGLHVIAAGSLLEVKIDKEGFSFPVGRVEYLYLFPATFDEFLGAIGETESRKLVLSATPKTEIPLHIHHLLMQKFLTYTIVGGMPEVVWTYTKTTSFAALSPVFESLLTGYSDDVYKYASLAKSKYLQHVIDASPNYAGQLITYERFGGSSYKSKDISDAMDTLEKAMVLTRIRGSFSTRFPLTFNQKKPPKLIFLDTGMVCYRLGLTLAALEASNLDDVARGKLSEQVVGQELLTISGSLRPSGIGYWYRHKAGATAEVDFLIKIGEQLIPIEVKSGKAGKLKSLSIYAAESHTPCCVRIYSGPPQTQIEKTPDGHPYRLLSLPFYLVGRLAEYYHACL